MARSERIGRLRQIDWHVGWVVAYVKKCVVGVGPAYAQFNRSSRQAQDPT